MSYCSRVYSHRNAHSHDEPSKEPFFARQNDINKSGQRSAFFQAKLSVNEPGDKYEREADSVANSVVNKNTSTPILQQKKISDIQRLSASMEDEKLSTNDARMEKDKKKMSNVQTKQYAGANSASRQVSSKIENSTGNGNALPPKMLNEMSLSFGVDFSNVRVHNDKDAVNMNTELNAQAFTHGRDIYFNQGKYNLENSQGKFLLAHELTHVVQQNSSIQKKTVQRTVGDGHDLTAERFAGDSELEAVFDGEKLLRNGASGDGVRKIQQALIDLGFNLNQFGADGKFGNETKKSVRQFQISNSLKVDGIIGTNTMSKFDESFKPVPPSPIPPLPNNLCPDDGQISDEKDPLPVAPGYTVKEVSDTEMLDELKKRRMGNQIIPPSPLGFSGIDKQNVGELKISALPLPGLDCKKCIAEWNVDESFISFVNKDSNSFEPKRFAPFQEGDITGCPSKPIPDLLPVRTIIKENAKQKIRQGEEEHYTDFTRAYSIVAGRYLSDVNRFNEKRSKIFGKDLQECQDKIMNLLLLFIEGNALEAALLRQIAKQKHISDEELFSVTFRQDLKSVYDGNPPSYKGSEERDESNDHTGTPTPPRNKRPFQPNIDLAKNPFGCHAFFRFLDAKSFPRIPGKKSSDVIKDINSPAKQNWHAS
ncbi:MAG TPA: DUF4157 domain-containing protein [Chitinophagaceae bacterium]|nr:DUF4157 domain-containing protein [Chitinophagaceae bacterium]